jgi:hypothetical protein
MAKKQKMVEWQQEEQAKQEPEKPATREELMKALIKIKRKRPLIKSSHR